MKVRPGLTRFFFWENASQNSPIIIVLIVCGSLPCIFQCYMYIYILNNASRYDVSVMCMSVMSLQKNGISCGWVGVVSYIRFFCLILGFFLALQRH